MPTNSLASESPADEEENGAWTRCMRAQNFSGAWAISDRILAHRNPAERDDPSQPYHLRWVWDGRPFDGKQVLVRCYHGLGDTLQFARFLLALRSRTTHVTLEVQPELCELFDDLPGVDKMVPFDTASPLPQTSCDLEIMELAHALRVDMPMIAHSVPYLHIAKTATAALPPSAEGAIGLCWEAGNWDVSRSISVTQLLQACMAPGRRFVSLQRGFAADEATDEAFVNPRDNDLSLMRTAAYIRAAHTVVTVDTMIAHLAGSLGQRAILLLKKSPDWRWPSAVTQSSGPSLWYPKTTILHQRHSNDWSQPLHVLALNASL